VNHNFEAEKGLLVAILSNLTEHLPRAEKLGVLTEWFYDEKNRQAFHSLHRLYASSLASAVPLKLETLFTVAQQDGSLEYLKVLSGEAAFAHGLTVDPLAREVNGWYGIRRTDEALQHYQEWRKKGASPAGAGKELISLHERLDDILKHRAMETGMPSEIQAQQLATPFPTGYRLFDKMLHGGYRNGTLVLIGAPTKGGKTVLAANLAARAVEQAFGVVVFQLEILPKMFQCQMLAGMTRIPFDTVVAIAEGREANIEAQEEINAQIQLLDTLVRIYSKADSIPEIAERIAWHKREFKDVPVLVIIDHLNRIRHPSIEKKGSGQALEEICYELHGIATARGLEVPIVLNGQLDDEAARKMKAKGHITDIDFKMRGSRAPEQASDSVIAFCRHPHRDAAAQFQGVYDRYKGVTTEGVLLYDTNTYRFSDAP